MELSAAGTPTVSPMGISMVAPVLMEFGSEEQKEKYLPPILRSDVWWCQGYSEPGAGSDLASLQMSAVRDGDDYVLNGSKIWTTHAQWADMIFCLVRTSKEGKTQEGISFIVFPMTLPGITISALPTLDGPLEGQQEINQVFFEDVRVPVADALVGEENMGWTYAKYLLQFERGNAYAPGLRNMLRKARKIASVEQSDGEALIRDHDFSRKLANMEIKIDSLDATEQRIFSALSAGWAGKLHVEVRRLPYSASDHRACSRSHGLLCRSVHSGQFCRGPRWKECRPADAAICGAGRAELLQLPESLHLRWFE
jgi:alkylation response protein AidB-like acyl-CoA dehydrogenase